LLSLIYITQDLEKLLFIHIITLHVFTLNKIILNFLPFILILLLILFLHIELKNKRIKSLRLNKLMKMNMRILKCLKDLLHFWMMNLLVINKHLKVFHWFGLLDLSSKEPEELEEQLILLWYLHGLKKDVLNHILLKLGLVIKNYLNAGFWIVYIINTLKHNVKRVYLEPSKALSFFKLQKLIGLRLDYKYVDKDIILWIY
jgi:hypothetical protein